MPVGGEEQIYVVQLQDDVVIFGPTVESASAVSYREALESLAPSALGQALSGAN